MLFIESTESQKIRKLIATIDRKKRLKRKKKDSNLTLVFLFKIYFESFSSNPYLKRNSDSVE